MRWVSKTLMNMSLQKHDFHRLSVQNPAWDPFNDVFKMAPLGSGAWWPITTTNKSWMEEHLHLHQKGAHLFNQNHRRLFQALHRVSRITMGCSQGTWIGCLDSFIRSKYQTLDFYPRPNPRKRRETPHLFISYEDPSKKQPTPMWDNKMRWFLRKDP